MKRLSIALAMVGFCHIANAEIYTFTGEEVAIPTKGPADPSFVYVENVEGVVTNISLTFNGISHRYGKETMIALSNPDGWATLIWDAPYCKFNNVNLLMSDTDAIDMGEACGGGTALEDGTYSVGSSKANHEFSIPIAPIRPLFETLNELILPDPNGRWILWAEDFMSGDGGTITSWELIIETQDPAY